MMRAWSLVCVLIVSFLWGAALMTAQEAPGSSGDGPTNAPVVTSAEANAPEAGDEEITKGMAFVLKLKQGGTTMIFLLAVSVFGVGCAIERLFRLRRGAIAPPELADRADDLWKQGRYQEVQDLEIRNKSALARTLAMVARHPRIGLAEITVLASDVASRELRRHLARAYPLAVVATISPLLGLLGTVVGMIGAFDKVAIAGSLGDASMLGGDISKALITTGVGLSIAVPALALYHYFRSKTNMYGMLLEEEVSELITKWFAPAEAGNAQASEARHEG